jgi:uncharacterized protein YdcH (DUF465 family)
MSHTPHELADDFPDQQDAIHALRAKDGHFAVLTDKYHEINRQVHRAETNLEPMEDLALGQLRKERMMLKDQIAAALSKA